MASNSSKQTSISVSTASNSNKAVAAASNPNNAAKAVSNVNSTTTAVSNPNNAATAAASNPNKAVAASNLKCVATLEDLSLLMSHRGLSAQKQISAKFGSINGLCTKLGIDPTKGVSGNKDDLEMRRKRFGTNKIEMKSPRHFLLLVWDALKDVTLIILFISAIVSLSLSFYKPGDEISSIDEDEDDFAWVEGVTIMLSILVVALVTSINNWTKERQFRCLQKSISDSNSCSVIRNGTKDEVLAQDLVVGDIVHIIYGNDLPADGIVIQSNDLKVDESSLTGETDLIKKTANGDPMLFSGTHVMEGSGKMLITAVGTNSQTGVVMRLLGATEEKKKDKSVQQNQTLSNQEQLSSSTIVKLKELEEEKAHSEKSILKQKLGRLAVKIGYFGISIAALTILVLVSRFCVQKYAINNESFEETDLKHFVHYLIVGVTVLVVTVPEGLPLAVTLSLTYSVRQMMKDNNLVRHLDATETMGNATIICSDKTGTLTTNRMTVVQSYINEVHHKETPKFELLDARTRDLLINAISINTSYTSQCEVAENPNEQMTHLGNKTECALLGFVLNMGQSYQQIRDAHPDDSFHKLFTFNSSRKSMTTILNWNFNGVKGYRLFTKGASEIILHKCKWELGLDGKLDTFNETDKQKLIKNVIEPMASDGLRTICLAYKDYRPDIDGSAGENDVTFLQNTDIDWSNEAEVTSNLTMLALVGIQDPVRPEVPNAIKQCQEAGIKTVMVTGDNINTARSIASACGILEGGEELVIESNEFNKRIRNPITGSVDQKRFDALWPNLRVLARAQPTDKYILVKHIINSRLSKSREVVAVTGDGTNDGPALKMADVGFAMGIAGTDVAKGACDIILTDDNFSSIVKAVMWGRNVYDTISKFLQFQLTVNIVAVVVVFVGACYIQDAPLKPVQILWINLIMDSLGSLALATETPTPELLKRKPYGRNSPLISPIMARNIIGHAIYQLTILLTLLFAAEHIFGYEMEIDNENLNSNPTLLYTLIFNSFVIMTQFNEINSRKINDQRNVFKGLLQNRIYCVIWISTFTIQALIVQFGNKWFKTEALRWYHWLACLGFAVGGLIWHQIIITIPPTIVPSFLTAAGKWQVETTEENDQTLEVKIQNTSISSKSTK